MSAETENEDTNTDQGNEEVEQEARAMGWVPQDEFRGDKSKWVDAEQFVEHGRKVMPILKKNNQQLIQDMASLRLQVSKLTKELEGAKEDLTDYQEFHQEELKRRVQETRAQLLQQLEVAHEEQDHKGVVKLTDQLTKLSAAEQDAEQRVNGKDVHDDGGGQQLDPAFLAWQQANPLFDRDPAFTFKAMAIAAEMRQEGITTTGKAWFDEVDRRLKGEQPQRRSNGKVEGSRGGSSGTRDSGGRTYADLPADAKAVCDRYGAKFVGENRQFKTLADYRKHYVQQLEQTGYFNQ